MRKKFFTGLVIILPIAIALMATMFIVQLCTAPFKTVIVAFLEEVGVVWNGWWIFSREQILQAVAMGSSIIFVLALLFFVGLFGRWVVSKYLFRLFDKVLLKLPLIGGVYKACRDFTDVIFAPQKGAFSQAAWGSFPSIDQKVLGFVTNEVVLQFPDGRAEKLTSLLLPGVPNPTVGFLVLFPPHELHFPQFGVETAIKWTLSFGAADAKTVEHDHSLE